MARALLVQGTSSSAGKSLLVTALCRIFRADGYKVAPFKAPNMALNSFVTPDGGDLGFAQALQARAAGIEPRVEMNPILLKPSGFSCSQVVVLGKARGTMSASEYHLGAAEELFEVVAAAYRRLAEEFEIIVIEGAGSPAEVNLQERDLANMRTARMAGAPVVLIADIDRGGALASLVGTLALLPADDAARVRGFVINKFRGDLGLLAPALTFLEERTGRRVVGVLPFLADLHLPAEDSASLTPEKRPAVPGELEVAVVLLPHISNFTDFDPFFLEPDVRVRYVRRREELGTPDLVIIPGTKNTALDLVYLHESGLARAIRELAAAGTPVCGICGGYQMLGKKLCDPEGVESHLRELPGLGLLDVETVFVPEKFLVQAEGEVIAGGGILEGSRGLRVKGYEIHAGRSFLGPGAKPFLRVRGQEERTDGAVDPAGLVFGTYFHGIFDNDAFRELLLNWLRRRRNLPEASGRLSAADCLEQNLDYLARVCREHLDVEYLYRLLGLL